MAHEWQSYDAAADIHDRLAVPGVFTPPAKDLVASLDLLRAAMICAWWQEPFRAPFRASTFDGAMANFVLSHLRSYRAALDIWLGYCRLEASWA